MKILSEPEKDKLSMSDGYFILVEWLDNNSMENTILSNIVKITCQADASIWQTDEECRDR